MPARSPVGEWHVLHRAGAVEIRAPRLGSPVSTLSGPRGVAVGRDQFDTLVQEVREVHDLRVRQLA